jgi:hypothetical protein
MNLMSDQIPTTLQPLAVGQVWTPVKGKARRIINVPHAPGVHYVTLPDSRTGWCDGSYMFRDWIRRTHATLKQEKANV